MNVLDRNISEIVKSNELQRELMSEYFKATGKHRFLDNCSKCIRETILEIKKTIFMTQCDYKLKKGIQVYWGKRSMHLSQETLTNEIAREFLADNKKHIAYFDELPTTAIPEQVPTKQVEPKKKKTRIKK
jgi:hypothetical protein